MAHRRSYLFHGYTALLGGLGFYRGYSATNRYLHGKEDVEPCNDLQIDRIAGGVFNSLAYVFFPFIPLHQFLGRLEIDRDPTRNKYSYDYFNYYKEFTNKTALPPRTP